jgi:hypothetical protein
MLKKLWITEFLKKIISKMEATTVLLKIIANNIIEEYGYILKINQAKH